MTIYGFTNDSGGTSTCDDGCAEAWPPVLIDGETLPAGLDADVFSVIERSDETYQLKAGDWPLYTFSGDSAPGDTNGQGTGGVWFVATADGQLQKDAAGSSDTTADDSPGDY
jgi:predicted lipoprotein with Yx(FWY)xxD motif